MQPVYIWRPGNGSWTRSKKDDLDLIFKVTRLWNVGRKVSKQSIVFTLTMFDILGIWICDAFINNNACNAEQSYLYVIKSYFNIQDIGCILIVIQNDKVSRLEEQCSVLQTKIVELQRSPFARSKQNDVLEDT